MIFKHFNHDLNLTLISEPPPPYILNLNQFLMHKI